MSLHGKPAGHVFISYVREDSVRVDRLQRQLEAAGIRVWRDKAALGPGDDWRWKIRRAITDNALVFIACFSERSVSRGKSFQNEELTLAIDQLRLRNPDDPWFMPVRFDDCQIPDRDVGGGRTLESLQHVDLFGREARKNARELVLAVRLILERGQQIQDGGAGRDTRNRIRWAGVAASVLLVGGGAAGSAPLWWKYVDRPAVKLAARGTKTKPSAATKNRHRQSGPGGKDVVGMSGGCKAFQVFAQNRWAPYGTSVRRQPNVLSGWVRGFPGNMSVAVNGWVYSRPAYPTNRAPFNNGIWFHLADNSGWVSFAGVRATPTAHDPTGVASGGEPAPHPNACEGAIQ